MPQVLNVGGHAHVERMSPGLPAESLAKELRGLKDLLNVAQLLVSSLDLDEVLQKILHSAMSIMDMPAGTIALYDPSTNKLQLHAHAGLSEAFTAHARWTVKPAGLTSEVLDRGELFVVEDTREAGFFNNPLAVAEGIRSLIAVPLMMQDEIIGVLYVDDFVPRNFPKKRLELLSALGSFAAVSIDNARLHQRTLELACTDGLTGLYNHRHFKKMFAEEVARAGRYHKPLSIIMCDVDSFKVFNDRFGHPNGDIVLQEIAGLLRQLLRGCDTICRYGGEEFVALLPETALAAAVHVAERIRGSVAERSPDFLGHVTGGQGVTVSVGVASFPEDGSSEELLLKAVDQLMYQAKRNGKNRVHCRSREG
jgi:diguanylate cyclase (GGDEF)-like protein